MTKVSFYTQLGITFKKLTGIQDISLMRKNLTKSVGKHIYKKKYTTQDIINTIASLGAKPGGVICIHASMKEFYNYQGTAKELIDAIVNFLTPEGTLMMPAYPGYMHKDINNYIFNPKTDKTVAGYLAETFRCYPGVVRSINVQHSVCAWGKHAVWLTQDHHLGNNCWDEFSPYYRMTQLNGLVINLGMPSFFIGTFDHCVEGMLYKEHPYWQQFLNKLQSYRYYNDQGEIKQYTCRTGDLECRTREKRLTRYFGTDIHKKKRLSNLLITIYDAKPCLEKMLDLGRHGITMYYVPSPKKYKF